MTPEKDDLDPDAYLAGEAVSDDLLIAEAGRLLQAEADATARYEAHVDGCMKEPVKCDEFMSAHNTRRAVREFAQKHGVDLMRTALAYLDRAEKAELLVIQEESRD